MNDVVNKSLIWRDKFILAMHLRQIKFTYNTGGSFTKNKTKKGIQKIKVAGDSMIYIYWNEPSKACFQHDIAIDNLKNLPERTASDKVLHNKAFEIVSNPKYDKC